MEKRKTEKKPKAKSIITHKAVGNGLAELVYRFGRPTFCVWSFLKRSWFFQEQLDIDGALYVPFNPARYVDNRHMFLAEEPMEYGTDEELCREIYDFLHRYVDYSDQFRRFDVWYALFTWIYDRYPALPYRRALGPLYGSGKTRWATVLGSICYRGYLQGAAATPASIYRLSDLMRGTQIFDETKFTVRTEIGQTLLKVLNSGYSSVSGLVTRCVGKDYRPTPFITYSPKLIAAAQKFPEPATESRTLTHRPYKTRRSDIPMHLTETFWKESLAIRNKLLLWRFTHYNESIKYDAEFGALPVHPRIKEVLISLASVIKSPKDKEWLKTLALERHAELVEDIALRPETTILRAIFGVFASKKHWSMGNIAKRIREDDPAETSLARPHRVGYWVRTALNLHVKREYCRETHTNPWTIVRSRDNFTRLQTLAEIYGLEEEARTITSLASLTPEETVAKTGEAISPGVIDVIEAIAPWLTEISSGGREVVSGELFLDRLKAATIGDRDLMKKVGRLLQERSIVRYSKETNTLRVDCPKMKAFLESIR